MVEAEVMAMAVVEAATIATIAIIAVMVVAAAVAGAVWLMVSSFSAPSWPEFCFFHR
jgi:hypothetical protein